MVSYLKDKYKSQMILVPPKTTPLVQPLDVALNSSFKKNLKDEWAAWLRDTPAKFTPGGYRQRPSYQAIVDMVSNALDAIQPEMIKRAFECCGIQENGVKVPMERLHEQLRNVLLCTDEEESATENDSDDSGAGADSGDEVLAERGADEEDSDDDQIIEVV